MEHTKRVRVVKRGRSGHETEPARVVVAKPESRMPGSNVDREVRDVVSDWVRDHKRRSEEFRHNYSTLLGEMGFKSPHLCGRVA
jgi:hypothetical protein